MQDMWIHGHTDRGIIGPIGGVVTAKNVDIDTNGMAGWDFDNGIQTASVNGTLNFINSTIEFSGCNQEYPFVHAIPVISCYSQSTGGYGDGLGTPPGMELNVNVSNSTSRYNTQDGMDFGHIDTGSSTMTVTDSSFYGNSGQQYKWGDNYASVVFENNLVNGNCDRMTAPLPGAPSTYNANLSDFCRAQSAMSWNYFDGATLLMANNTMVSYSPGYFVIGCNTASGCSHVVTTFQNNILLGYDNPTTYNQGAQAGGPAVYYCQDNTNNSNEISCATQMGTWNRADNIYYGMRATNFTCPTGFPGETCVNPQLMDQPTGNGAAFVESELDNFNYALSNGSPAIGAGVQIPGLTLDYSGIPYMNPPNIGAY